MVAYGKPMRPSLVDVMAEVNALDSELTKKLVLIVGYTGSVYPAPATLEHTDGTAVTYDELASIANTVVTAFDTHFGAAVLADIQKQIDDSIEISYQTSRYDETAQAIVFDKVTVSVDSSDTPTISVDTDTFSGGGSGGGGETVEIINNSATLSFDELKAIAQSRNPTVKATIIGATDQVENVFSRVFYSLSHGTETIQVISSAVYSISNNAIGCYLAENVRGSNVWNLWFQDVDGNTIDIGVDGNTPDIRIVS